MSLQPFLPIELDDGWDDLVVVNAHHIVGLWRDRDRDCWKMLLTGGHAVHLAGDSSYVTLERIVSAIEGQQWTHAELWASAFPTTDHDEALDRIAQAIAATDRERS